MAVSRFGRDMPWGSSYSTCRDPVYNHWRVCNRLTCRKWTSNHDYWTTFRQWKPQNFGIVRPSLGNWVPYIYNFLAQVESIGWSSSNNPNQIWGGRFNNANIIINSAWGDPINASPTNSPRSPGRPRSAQRYAHKSFFVAGVMSVCDVNLIAAILRFVGKVKTGMVR